MANVDIQATPTPVADRMYPWWVIHPCKWFWKHAVKWFWSAIILTLALGILVNWFTDFTKVPDILVWMYHNWSPVLSIFVVLLALTAIIGITAQLQPEPSERLVSKTYLANIESLYTPLNLEGLSGGLVTADVSLEDVFIRPMVHPATPTDIQLPFKEELQPYIDRRTQGRDIDDVSLLLKEDEAERASRKVDVIDVAELWKRMTLENPVAVIEGSPGIGKSTLLYRLMLSMAHLVQKETDPDAILTTLRPALIPIYVSLREFAEQNKDTKQARSMLDYIKTTAATFNKPDVPVDFFVERWLTNGRCLIMFDGLDEVSEGEQRKQVRDAIKLFIQQQRHPINNNGNKSDGAIYNRFLITTRIAGYDREAFPSFYRHYIMAHLSLEQIEEFLPRWIQASTNTERLRLKESLDAYVQRLSNEMMQVVRSNQGVRRLAETPLLLTLMVIMKQNNRRLPEDRAELYKTVIETLLETRNTARGMQKLSVVQAIQWLGPLARTMHEAQNGLALKSQILDAIEIAIRSPQEGGANLSVAEVQEDAETYFTRLSVRGGLLVKKLSSYYGFLHPTFREYFVARHMLNEIEYAKDKDKELNNFITLVRQQDIWREPYLLAVAHKSKEHSPLANQLIQALLDAPGSSSEKLYNAFLVATAIIESEEYTIDRTLQRDVFNTLLRCYHEALQAKRFSDCKDIEDKVKQWLLNLGKESFQPPVLDALRDALINDPPTRQRSTLTLLAIIVQQLISSPCEAIFDTLVPPLLALAGLPGVVSEQKSFTPTSHLAPSNDLTVQDIALTVLSFMGRRGPAGVLLAQTRAGFERFVPQLARYSLDSGTLITPTLVPLSNDNYRPYEAAFAQWITLRDSVAKKPQPTDADKATCEAIQRTLLDSAEEVSYPTSLTLLELLQASQGNNDWEHVKQTWQKHLLEILNGKNISYLAYFDTILFYNSLFVASKELEPLAFLMEEHFKERATTQLFATRFLAYISDILRYYPDMRDMRYLRNLKFLRFYTDLRFSHSLQLYQEYLNLPDYRYLRDLRGLRHDRNLRYLENLQDSLLTDDIAHYSMNRLYRSQLEIQNDLLLILLGRVLHVEERGNVNEQVEQEIQGIVQGTRKYFISADSEVRDLAREIEMATKRVVDRVR